jgi:hypothetical protein
MYKYNNIDLTFIPLKNFNRNNSLFILFPFVGDFSNSERFHFWRLSPLLLRESSSEHLPFPLSSSSRLARPLVRPLVCRTFYLLSVDRGFPCSSIYSLSIWAHCGFPMGTYFRIIFYSLLTPWIPPICCLLKENFNINVFSVKCQCVFC